MVNFNTKTITKNNIIETINELTKDSMACVDEIIENQCQSDVELVSSICKHLIHSGGKRLRPKVLLLSAGALGNKDKESHEVACVIEFIHSATLLHDDVVDQSHTRRHQPSANQIWGNSASVLVGDFLYSRAFQILAWRNNIPLMRLLAETTAKLAEGEVHQLMDIGNEHMSIANYEKIIANKTGAMFAAASCAGAIIANPNNNQIQQDLYDYGMSIGMAFQIIDDLLDYQSTEKTLGKAIGKDFLEGKVTLPLILTMQKATPEEKSWLQSVIKKPKINDLEPVIQLMQQHGAFESAYNHALTHVKHAQTKLCALGPSPQHNALQELSHYAVDRDV